MDISNYKIGIFIILCIIIFLIIYLIFSSSEKEKQTNYKVGKFVEYSGMFKRVSNLNIGHDTNAPIFNARPYFGENQFNNGLGEYFGVIKIKSTESIFMEFQNTIKNNELYYEVNLFKYPSWEHIGETFLSPKKLSIGTSTFDTITLNSGDQIIILITGFMNKELMNSWLSKSKIYTNEKTKLPFTIKQLSYDTLNDNEYHKEITIKYENFVKKFLKTHNNYKIIYEIKSSQSNEESFPPTNGIIESISYTPEKLNQILIIIIPNRKLIFNTESVTYLESDNKKIYFSSNDKEIVNIYTYSMQELNDVYIEERILISNKSENLPFYLYVAEIK
jgi:hypothetical protein